MAKKKTVGAEKDTGIRYLMYNIQENDAFIYEGLGSLMDGMCVDDFGVDGNYSVFKVQFLEELEPEEKLSWKTMTPMDLSSIV